MNEQEMRESMAWLRRYIMWMQRDKRFVAGKTDLFRALTSVTRWEAAHRQTVPDFNGFLAVYIEADKCKDRILTEALFSSTAQVEVYP